MNISIAEEVRKAGKSQDVKELIEAEEGTIGFLKKLVFEGSVKQILAYAPDLLRELAELEEKRQRMTQSIESRIEIENARRWDDEERKQAGR